MILHRLTRFYRIGHEANSEESQDSVIILKSNNPEIVGEQVITGFYNQLLMKVISFWDSKIQGFLQHPEIPGFYFIIKES